MVGFVLATNMIAIKNNSEMFNDGIVQLYCVLCVYFLAKRKPLLSTWMIGIGLTLKAGPLLQIPVVLGIV